MKVISFNINGLRARLHQLQAVIDKHQPDVIGLQEIKVHDEAFPVEDVEAMGYKVYFHGQKHTTVSPCYVRKHRFLFRKAFQPTTKIIKNV